MPDERLAELLRQRALLSRHVAWLDAEIARAGAPGDVGIQPAPSKQPPPPSVPAAISAPSIPEPEAEPEAVALANKRADEIIARYAATDSFNPDSTRRGCLLISISLFLIGASVLVGIYLLNYR
jgi:hypothetical protein